MARLDKKQRHKAKREAKRREARRRESISPLKRLADAPGEIEYWMSDGFDSFGQVSLFVFKRAAGLTGIACFLVDRGVVGLKDAWARMNIDRAEFSEMLDTCKSRGIAMNRATADEIRRMVAGGIRWAHDNGMRLPKEWAKPASLLGGVGDWASADVSLFVKEFAGHPEDLRQRLIGEPFDDYIRRADVTFIFSDSAPHLDQETGEYVGADDEDDDGYDDDDEDDEDFEGGEADIPEVEIDAILQRYAPTTRMLASETAAWLKARGEAPSPELFAAWGSIMLATILSKAAMPDAPQRDAADFGVKLLTGLAGRIEKQHRAEYRKAVHQALEHLQTEPMMMQNAMLKYGLGDD